MFLILFIEYIFPLPHPGNYGCRRLDSPELGAGARGGLCDGSPNAPLWGWLICFSLLDPLSGSDSPLTTQSRFNGAFRLPSAHPPAPPSAPTPKGVFCSEMLVGMGARGGGGGSSHLGARPGLVWLGKVLSHWRFDCSWPVQCRRGGAETCLWRNLGAEGENRCFLSVLSQLQNPWEVVWVS